MSDWIHWAAALQLAAGGVAIGSALLAAALAGSNRGQETRWFGRYTGLLGLGMCLNGLVLFDLPGPADALMLARTVSILATVGLIARLFAALGPRRASPWLEGALLSVVLIRFALWIGTDLVYTHTVDADGLPVYGDLLAATSLPLLALWLAIAAIEVRGVDDPDARRILVTGLAGSGLVAGGSLATSGVVAEAVTGLSQIPLALAIGVVVATRHRRRVRHTELFQRERNDLASELVASNRDLRRAVRVREELLDAATHELKTPLTPMIGSLRFLRQYGDRLTGEDVQQQLELAERNAVRLNRLVDEFLQASRLRSGAATPDQTMVPLAPLVGEVADLFANDLAVHCDVAEELEAWIDAEHLHRILLNLLSNAAKYGADPVHVRASKLEGEVLLSVRDHGPGVPAAFVDELFGAFTQASVGNTRESVGVGLGLSIASRLAEVNGARLEHREAEPGACFVLRMPARGPLEA